MHRSQTHARVKRRTPHPAIKSIASTDHKTSRFTGMPEFTHDPVAVDMIRKAVTRAISVYAAHNVTLDRMMVEMDLSATHANGNPLDFDKLLAFDDFSFMHDITGIYRNLNRDTGELENFFSPRCSARTDSRPA